MTSPKHTPMKTDILANGACGLVLGEKYYRNYIPIKDNKLVKVTYLFDKHNEFTHLDEIKKIKNYADYYGLPESKTHSILPNDKFFSKLEELVNKEIAYILEKKCIYFYVDYAGDMELYNTIITMKKIRCLFFWRSYTDIINCIQQLVTGLVFLHQIKICHLDVKSENVMVDTTRRTFKLIDFGFASKEPFKDFTSNVKGTPGYFPEHYSDLKVTDYFPLIRANDMKPVDDKIPMLRNHKLVYKIDSYCLGRLIYCLETMFTEVKQIGCYNSGRKSRNKIIKIQTKLLENDVEKRAYLQDIYNEFFVKKKITCV
jgi:serine/threonine protein kinase